VRALLDLAAAAALKNDVEGGDDEDVLFTERKHVSIRMFHLQSNQVKRTLQDYINELIV